MFQNPAFPSPVFVWRLSAAAILCLFCAFPAWAQSQGQDNSAFGPMAPIVVSPTGFATPENQIGNSITVITADQIERNQQRTLPDALKDVPGLNVVQTGGPGGQTSVFIRGTNSNHTKVLVDGIDMGDPSTPNDAFDFSQIPTWDIERIEVLRGPQSGLYGSDAIGGVVNIVTKQGSGPMLLNAMAEGGSFGTFNQAAGVSGGLGRANYDFNFVHLRTADLPVTPDELLAPGETRNNDFSSNRAFSGKAGAALTDNLSVNLVSRYTDTTERFTQDDNCPAPSFACFPNPSQSTQREHAFFTRGEAKLLSLDGVLENSAGVAYTHYNRSNFDPLSPAPPYNTTGTFSGDRTKLDWKGVAHLGGERTAVLGLENQTDSFAGSQTSASVRNRAGFAEFHTPVLPRLYSTASVRVDDNSTFGRAVTYRLATAYFVPGTGTQLKASYGTGFKAPTLTQLYEPTYGNAALRPEESRGFDLGFEQSLWNKRLNFGATYFHNNIHNLIEEVSPSFQNFNVNSAMTYGAENFVAWKPAARVDLRADYTYTYTRDDSTGSSLTRRPKHKASLDATWTPLDPLSLTASMLWEGPWLDFGRESGASVTTSGYTRVDLAVSYKVSDHATFFGRIDNLLDRHYEEPVGWDQPPLGIFAGVKLSWGGDSE